VGNGTTKGFNCFVNKKHFGSNQNMTACKKQKIKKNATTRGRKKTEK